MRPMTVYDCNDPLFSPIAGKVFCVRSGHDFAVFRRPMDSHMPEWLHRVAEDWWVPVDANPLAFGDTWFYLHEEKE